MADERLQFGDRVRHAKRPEWGVGSVVKVENVAIDGKPAERVSVRFPGVGIKRLLLPMAELTRVLETEAPETPNAPQEPEGVREWDAVEESGWLAPVARRKIGEAMTRLPEQAHDPFLSLPRRLEFTLGLYRFDRSGRGLIDWAVAQTGLNDPLSRFNRHELEQYFDRWAAERDAHLARLVADLNGDRGVLDRLLEKAPPGARQAVRRLTAVR